MKVLVVLAAVLAFTSAAMRSVGWDWKTCQSDCISQNRMMVDSGRLKKTLVLTFGQKTALKKLKAAIDASKVSLEDLIGSEMAVDKQLENMFPDSNTKAAWDALVGSLADDKSKTAVADALAGLETLDRASNSPACGRNQYYKKVKIFCSKLCGSKYDSSA